MAPWAARDLFETRLLMRKRLFGKNILRGVTGPLLAQYVRFVRRTSTVTYEPADCVEQFVADAPQIVAMWHGQFVLIPATGGVDRVRTHAMVARHGDGDLIGKVLSAFGVPMIRGAGAGGRRRDRGGAAALRAAIRALDDGDNVAMTADVPPGPARMVGTGIVTLARMSGRPIRPVAVASSNYWAFDTWSRMTLNLPFSRIGFVVGEPIVVPRQADAATLDHARKRVEMELNRVTRRAYELARSDPTRATPRHALPTDAPPEPMSARLRAYRFATSALEPFAPAILRRRQTKGKEDPERIAERFGRPSAPRPEGQLAWFHAASVGETMTAMPVIRDFAARRPDINVLLTTGTRTSAEIVRDRMDGRVIHQYVPIDTRSAVRRFLEHWKPDLCVLTESEIWPNMVIDTHARGIPIVLMNARMSPRSYDRWRRSRAVALPLFSRISLVLAQSKRLERQFRSLGARRVETVGNLKIDAPALPVDEAELVRTRAMVKSRHLMLAASTHPGEDEIVLIARQKLAASIPDLLTIIAPRHPDRGRQIEALAKESGLAAALRSRGDDIADNTDLYVADTIGELGLLYSLCPVAFIGGSLVSHGGQNPVEAVRLRCAVVTGPHRFNFVEAYEALLGAGGAMAARSADELAEAFQVLLTDEERLRNQVEHAEASLASLSGASAATLERLLDSFRDNAGMKRAS